MDYFLIAKVEQLYGKDGFVRLEAHSDFPERYLSLEKVYIDFWGDKKTFYVEDVKDVKGKKFMCVEYSSFGGAHMVWRLLLEHGIDPKKDCKAFLEGKTHDNVVMAVKDGVVDVGPQGADVIRRGQARTHIA